MKNVRARVLLIAYACRPGESSEREVGWQWANLIQRNHDVTVLTRSSHRSHIEAALIGSEIAPSFIYYDLPSWALRFKRGERGLYLYYILWNHFAVRKTRTMNKNDRWQITHFLTFGTLLWPQFAYRMSNAYVLGPVGGGELIPTSLKGCFGAGTQLKILLRRITQKLLFLNPIHHANLKGAGVIFARTHETLEIIPSRYKYKAELLLETAISVDQVHRYPPVRNNQILEIVAVGRLIPSKFNSLMLEAIAEFKAEWNQPFKVTIIGDGPELTRLQELRDKLNLNEVNFVGRMSSKEVYAALRKSDIYFSTTMKEAGSWAFFEAIICYLPIVCLKVNGPDMIVGNGCGIKVQPTNIVETRKVLAKGLLTLAKNPALRVTYAEGALAYVKKTYTWHHVAQSVDDAYSKLLEKQEKI